MPLAPTARSCTGTSARVAPRPHQAPGMRYIGEPYTPSARAHGEVEEEIWLVSFSDFDFGYCDEPESRVEPGPNPLLAKVLTMSSA